MLDVRIDNVVIIDGAGSPAFPGSLGIKNGRIEAVGKVEASAATVVDG
jgi:N-acyl-D-amino-acid deacylase